MPTRLRKARANVLARQAPPHGASARALLRSARADAGRRRLARFLILYAAGAVAGSLASTWWMQGLVSVGASGALWGILAAEAVFAFTPGFLPAIVVPQARRTAMINLGLNVAASTLTHVDWAAHAGGGIVGAVLVYFVLSRGVPRGDAPAAPEPITGPGLRVAAVLAAVLLAAGAIAGPTLGGGLFPLPSAPNQ